MIFRGYIWYLENIYGIKKIYVVFKRYMVFIGDIWYFKEIYGI